MKKHDLGPIATIESAQIIFNRGVAVVVTDGQYIQLVKESDKAESEISPSLKGEF